VTPASFEPTIDYVVIKMPRWNFEKFPEADRTLTTQMKSIGEAMAIGRTFKEAFLKACGRSSWAGAGGCGQSRGPPGARRGGAGATADAAARSEIWALFAASSAVTVERVSELTRIDRGSWPSSTSSPARLGRPRAGRAAWTGRAGAPQA